MLGRHTAYFKRGNPLARSSPTAFIEKLGPTERLKRAKEILRELTGRIDRVLLLNETCKIVVYSDTISKQIPESHAGHAFADLQNALHEQLIIRTLALWDKAAENALSIPTVLALIDSDAVVTLIKKAVETSWLESCQMPSEGADEFEKASYQLDLEFARERAKSNVENLRNAVQNSDRIKEPLL